MVDFQTFTMVYPCSVYSYSVVRVPVYEILLYCTVAMFIPAPINETPGRSYLVFSLQSHRSYYNITRVKSLHSETMSGTGETVTLEGVDPIVWWVSFRRQEAPVGPKSVRAITISTDSLHFHPIVYIEWMQQFSDMRLTSKRHPASFHSPRLTSHGCQMVLLWIGRIKLCRG